jgi:hypothetical protein
MMSYLERRMEIKQGVLLYDLFVHGPGEQERRLLPRSDSSVCVLKLKGDHFSLIYID